MKESIEKYAKILILLALSIMVLSGCSYSIGSVKSSMNGKIDHSYVTFNGKEHKSIKFKQGETIVLDYKVTVKKGTLTLNVTSPDNEKLWEVKLDKNTSDTVKIPAKKTGSYVINMIGEKTGGGLHIKISKE